MGGRWNHRLSRVVPYVELVVVERNRSRSLAREEIAASRDRR